MKFSKTFLVILFCLVLLFLIFQDASNKLILQAQTGGNQGPAMNLVPDLPGGGNTGSSGGDQGPYLNYLPPGSLDKGNTGPYSTSAPAPENVQNKNIPNSSVTDITQDPSVTNKFVTNVQYFDMLGKRQGIMITALYGPNPCTPYKLGGTAFFAFQLVPYPFDERYAYMPVNVSYSVEFRDFSGNVVKRIEGTSKVDYVKVDYAKQNKRSTSGWIYGFYKPQEIQSIAGSRRVRLYYDLWFDTKDPANIIQLDLWARDKSILLSKKGYKKPQQAQKNNLLKDYKQISSRAGGILAVYTGSGPAPMTEIPNTTGNAQTQELGSGWAKAYKGACQGEKTTNGGGKKVGCPVDMVDGTLVEDYTDMTFPSMPPILRHYDVGVGYQPGRNFGWMFNFEEFLRFDPDGSIFYRNYEFTEYRFLKNLSNPDNYIPSRSDNLLKLRKDSDGNYEVTFKDQSKKVFNSIGYLINTVDSKGNVTNYTWNIPFKQMKENYDMPAELIALNGPSEMFRKSSTLTITDPYGRSVYIDFNETGRVSKITDWAGRYVEYKWVGNDGMFLMAFKDLQGNETQFLYQDNMHTRISEIKYPNGTRIRNNYITWESPNAGVVKSQNLTDGGYISYDYGWLRDPQERWTTVDESGRVVKFYYDNDGNIIKTEEPGPNGTVTYRFSYTYQTKCIGAEETPIGLLESKTDPLGRKTSFGYDSRGNLTAVKNAQGKNIRCGYDSKNRIINLWDELNRNIRFEYDNKNNLISITNNDGSQKKFEYDDRGRLTKAINENGNYITYEYGAYGNLAKVTDQENGYIRFYRDSLGRAVKVDENGFEASYEYDNFNNITGITDGAGNSTRIAYDGNCNIIKITDPNGKVYSFEYDAFNRLKMQTNPEGNASHYRYTTRGKLFNIADPMRGYIGLDYNSADYTSQVRDQISTVTYYNYDAAGNITTVSNPTAGKRTEFVYDELNRIIKKISSNEALYEYDDTGNVKAVKDESGQMVYEYDDRNRLAKVSYPFNNIKIEFKYDKAGNLTYFKHINGKEFYYEYDKANKPVSITKRGEGAVNFKYNEGNNLAMIEYPNGVKEFIAYNNIRNIVRIKYISDKSGEVLYQVGYEYDKAGRIITKEESGIGRKHSILTYVYTGSGKLAQVKMNDKVISQYIYDANGNRTSSLTSSGNMKYNYDAANHLLSTSQSGYSYDGAGNLIKEETGSKVKNYIYDMENNFIKFEFSGAGKFSESYSYNADNLRLSKECKEKKEKNNLIWLGWELLGGLNSNGDFSFVNYDSGFEKDGKSYLCLEDIQGSVMGLIDDKGNPAAVFGYDEFGNPISAMAYSEPTPAPAPSGSPGQPGATPAPPAQPPKPGTPVPQPTIILNLVPSPQPTATGTHAPPKPTGQPGTPAPKPTVILNLVPQPQPTATGTPAPPKPTGQPGTPVPQPTIILNLVPSPQPGQPGTPVPTQTPPKPGEPGGVPLPPAPQPGDIQTGVGGPAGALNNGQVAPPTNQLGQPGTPVPQAVPSPGGQTPVLQPGSGQVQPMPQPTVIGTSVPTPQPGQPTTSPPKPSGQAGQQAFIMPAANAQETVQTNTQVKKPNAFIEFIKKIFTFWKKPETEKAAEEKEIVNKIESPIRFAGYYYDSNTELYYVKSRYYDPKIGRFTQPDKIGYESGFNLYAYCDNDPVNYIDPKGTISIGGIRFPPPRTPPIKPGDVRKVEAVVDTGKSLEQGARQAKDFVEASQEQIQAALNRLGGGAYKPPGTLGVTPGAPGAIAGAGSGGGGAGANSPNNKTDCTKGAGSSSSGTGTSQTTAVNVWLLIIWGNMGGEGVPFTVNDPNMNS